MLDYARQRAVEVLKTPSTAILATSGPAGLQASEVPCQALGLVIYLLVPRTSDHLFNLEHDPRVTVLAAGWEVRGEAQVKPEGEADPGLGMLWAPEAEWCVLVRVDPTQVHIRAEGGWGNRETIDLK